MPIGFILSVHPPASIGSAPTVHIFVKFDIGNFYYNLWRKSIFVSNQTIPDILHGDLSVFPIVDSSMCSSTVLRTTILNNALLHHHGDAFSTGWGISQLTPLYPTNGLLAAVAPMSRISYCCTPNHYILWARCVRHAILGWRGVNRRMPHRGVNWLMPHPVFILLPVTHVSWQCVVLSIVFLILLNSIKENTGLFISPSGIPDSTAQQPRQTRQKGAYQ